MDSIAVLRAGHVAAAVLLLGNVVVTGFWAAFLFRVRSAVPFRQVARAILWADVWFTLLGGVALTITGILLTRARGLRVADTPWLLQGIVALALSTAVWLVALLPDQLRLERIDAVDDRALRRLFLRWSVLGWMATALLFFGLWAMVTKA